MYKPRHSVEYYLDFIKDNKCSFEYFEQGSNNHIKNSTVEMFCQKYQFTEGRSLQECIDKTEKYKKHCNPVWFQDKINKTILGFWNIGSGTTIHSKT